MPTGASDAEFTKGEPGVDEQMDQGEASQLNDGLELAREMDDGEEAAAAGGGPAGEVDDSMQPATLADFEPQASVRAFS